MVRGFWLAAAAAAIGATLIAAAPRASVEKGRHLATTLGCLSCHEADLTGHVVMDDPTIATLWTSNLSRALPRYSDMQLETVLRTGVRPDDSHLWYMDAAPYAVMTAADMRNLIAFLRTVPPKGEDRPRIRMGPRFIKALNAKRFAPESVTLAHDLANPPADLGPQHAQGRYLARTVCAGCHAPSLNGMKDPQEGDPPNLDIAAGYDLPAFLTLVRTGKTMAGKDAGEMAVESPKRLAVLSDADVASLHRYLVARALKK